MHGYMILPDGPAALGHPANEDLFGGTPVRRPFRGERTGLGGLGSLALPLVGIEVPL
jgi:hypothetical protein